MKNYLELLKSVDLFKGIEPSDIGTLLSCLSAKQKHYDKNQIVFLNGENNTSFGIVLSGQVQIFQEDYFGNKSILGNVGVGSPFAEAFAFSERKTLPVSVITTAESDILFIDSQRLAAPCSSACGFHSRLIQNMLNIIAGKNIALTQKIEFTSKRTTREKLIAYLSAQARTADSSRFTIAFNRQELADFLSVDRSAMSTELSKLKDDGFLTYHKNQFELL